MQISVYNLISKFEYESNSGDPDVVDSQYFTNIEEAMDALSELVESTEPTTEHGKFMLVELCQSDIDINDDVDLDDIDTIIPLVKKHFAQDSGEPIESIIIESALIPEGSVIVEYEHHTYMNYAYNIKSIRISDKGDTYCSALHVQHDKTMTSWDEVYESTYELYNAYLLGHGIFEKINNGSSIIEDFLDNSDYPVNIPV